MNVKDSENSVFLPVSVSKENSFDLLRLLCCLIVIYEHCVVLSGVELPCLNLRGIAVKVFFVLSGFWVTQSYLKSVSVKEYALKRCKKILPQYWIVVLVGAIFLSGLSKLSVREYFCNSGFYKYLAANISTLNFIHPGLPGVFEGLALDGSVNGSLWTIKIEIGFYILLPFVVFLMKKINGGGYRCAVLAALYLLSVLYEVFMPFVTEKTFLPAALAHQFPAFISYFAGGMAFSFYGEYLVSKLKFVFAPCFALLVVLSIFKVPFVSVFLIPGCLAVCVMFIGLNFKFFSCGGRKTDYSYSLYLVHYPLAMCFVSLGFFENKPVFAIFSVLGTSFLCAYLLENFQKILFEKNSESAAAGSLR